jgi:cell division protein FtsQ
VSALGAVLGRVAVPGRAAARLLRSVPVRRPSPRMQRFLVIALAVSALLTAFYYVWLRDSSFVRVQQVTVGGLDTRDAARVRAALTTSARTMTTLHVDHETLMQAVEPYPVVRDLRVSSDFPHGLRIVVIQHTAAAIAVADGLKIPVAGDGTLLRGVPVEGRLPTIQVSGKLGTERLTDRGALQEARVLGGAPVELRSRLDGVEVSEDKGLVVEMREGPELIFGDVTRVRDKWDAAARVLADPTARGATYIDLRLPDRPAAGGVAADTVTPVAPAGGVAEPESQAPATTTPDPAAQAPAAPEQASPATPEQAAPVAPDQPEPAPVAPQQAPVAPQQSPPAQPPPTQGTPGGGATANPQP